MRRLIKRLRPYGSVLPSRHVLRHPNFRRVYLLGVCDGWMQPHELSTSINVDHMVVINQTYGYAELVPELYDTLDAGINLGQWLRSPLNHQQQEPEAV